MKFNFYMFLAVWMLILAGCGEAHEPTVQKGQSDLLIYEDESRGVTCYRIRNYTGVSCLKTKPSAKEELENKMIQEIFQPKGE